MQERVEEGDWRREIVKNNNNKKNNNKGRSQESIAAANKGTVSTIRSASTVHRGL